MLVASACAPPPPLSQAGLGRRTVVRMGIWEQECAGGGDGHCPEGAVVDARSRDPRCPDCREDYELDEHEPDRRVADDGGLTRPMGDPREAGQGAPA